MLNRIHSASLKALKPNLSQLYCCKAEGRDELTRPLMALKPSSRLLFLSLVLFSLRFIHRLLPAFLLACGDKQLQKKKKRSLFHSSISLLHVCHDWTMNLYGKRRHILCQCHLLWLTINFIQTGPFRDRSKLVFVLFSVVNNGMGNHQLFALEAGFEKAVFVFTLMFSHTHSNHAVRI